MALGGLVLAASCVDDPRPVDTATSGQEATTCGVLAAGAAPEAERAVQHACALIGTAYSWGGGHGATPGPSFGLCDPANGAPNDCHVKGLDCSGAVRYEYSLAVGSDIINGTSASQFESSRAVARFTAAQGTAPLLPGDLTFFGPTAAGIHHVAIYLGQDMIVEAPFSGGFVRMVNIGIHGDYFGAIRLYPGGSAPEWYVLSGDWDGNGTKTPGLYNARTHQWLLSNHNSGGGVDYNFGWGGGTQIPVVGDWNGDGTDTPGLYNPTTHVWTLSNHNSGGGVDAQFGWGGGDQVPLAGDWNGDGIDTPGLFNPASHVWTLSNFNAAHGVDAQFGWGGGDQIPLVGDWNGDGTDTPGLYNPATHVWTLSNHNSGGGVDAQFGWGGGTRLPVVGDWNGDGSDTPGLFLGSNREFTLSNVNSGGGVAADFGWGPVGDYTVAGAH
jgi:cell wall-associated NlpC family hydrolase